MPYATPPAARAEDVTGKTVQTVLEVEKLAQWDLAHRLGVSQTQISRWIKEENRVHEIVRHILSCAACYQHFVVDVSLRSPRSPEG